MAAVTEGVPDAEVEVIYFDGQGRAELTRLALKAGGVPFKDTRFSFAEWPTIKQGIPSQRFGSVPLLKHGELLLAQSQATALYAAELGLTPSLTKAQRAYDLMYLGWHADMQSEMYKVLFAKDEEAKAAAKEAFMLKAPTMLGQIEAMLPDTGFIHGAESPSLGDLAVYNIQASPFPGVIALGVDTSPFPKLTAIKDAVDVIVNPKE
eukprot:CAMPEP_0185745922 /NCGR_PEP_ID=MMETSP1174-20130828/4317_1 /TAXON_ID=35687 /ORGANISM="Dictyocha speculum, Strain CCMP1381" /LENGTH=206 /DNA_ID=CAMNT_0028420217 /DNA_START=49 /DNA_END=669 /DNA_ORIENTATION=-